MEYIIVHHGIQGQKWGVRRWQNPDGTFNEAGKIRYGRIKTNGSSSSAKSKNSAKTNGSSSEAKSKNNTKTKVSEEQKKQYRNIMVWNSEAYDDYLNRAQERDKKRYDEIYEKYKDTFRKEEESRDSSLYDKSMELDKKANKAETDDEYRKLEKESLKYFDQWMASGDKAIMELRENLKAELSSITDEQIAYAKQKTMEELNSEFGEQLVQEAFSYYR